MTVRRFATPTFSQVVRSERFERGSPGGIETEREGCLERERVARVSSEERVFNNEVTRT